ncbi:hypothetical protein [Geobacillus sp. Geo 8.1]
MKTITVTESELATLKTALHMQIQTIEKEIKWAKKDGKNVEPLIEIKQQYEQAFEALSFAN